MLSPHEQWKDDAGEQRSNCRSYTASQSAAMQAEDQPEHGDVNHTTEQATTGELPPDERDAQEDDDTVDDWLERAMEE
jgi:hypothetical protein